MVTYNDNGIVLSSHNLSESDKIINIYTRNHGLVRAIAKGSRKTKSKFKGKIEKITALNLLFAKGKNLDIVSEAEITHSFSKLKTNLSFLSYGFLFCEIVKSFAHEREQDSFLTYDLLLSNLEKIPFEKDLNLLTIKFILEFLSIHGLLPQTENCVSCNADVDIELGDKKSYSIHYGGVLCHECSNTPHIIIESSILKLIKSESQNITDYGIWEKSSIGNEEQHKIDKSLLIKTIELLKEHINHHGKEEIKSFDLVFSI